MGLIQCHEQHEKPEDPQIGVGLKVNSPGQLGTRLGREGLDLRGQGHQHHSSLRHQDITYRCSGDLTRWEFETVERLLDPRGSKEGTYPG